MALETEIARYNELLPELLTSSEGKFAVICGRELVGTYETNSDAYAAGLESAGLKAFLLRKVLRVRPVVLMPSFSLVKPRV